MKSPSSFALGTVFGGVAVSACFYFCRPYSHSFSPASEQATPKSIAVTAPSSPIASGSATTNSVVDDQSLEKALREISEAGMIVIPQEFVRFLSPRLFATQPDAALREILKLDGKEAAALAKAQSRLYQSIEAAAGAHLQITESKDGTLTGVLPAFPEERQRFIDTYREESAAALDAESAALFANIDLDQALAQHMRGTREFAVKIKRTGGDNYVMELKAQTQDGSFVTNATQSNNFSRKHLVRLFPTVADHLPPAAVP
jgi:hypothetical protein